MVRLGHVPTFVSSLLLPSVVGYGPHQSKGPSSALRFVSAMHAKAQGLSLGASGVSIHDSDCPKTFGAVSSPQGTGHNEEAAKVMRAGVRAILASMTSVTVLMSTLPSLWTT